MSAQPNLCPSFISTVLDMMKKHNNIIDWNQDGTQLAISDTKSFTFKVLPEYFKHRKFESFARQLNMYGFHKVCRNKNTINFKNRYFIKDQQQLYGMIKRKKKEVAEIKASVNTRQHKLKQITQQKYKYTYPMISDSIADLLKFKSQSLQCMIEMKKDLEQLSRNLNGRKTKTVKPLISEAKDAINILLDKAHETNQNLQNMEEQLLNQCDSKGNQCDSKGNPIIPSVTRNFTSCTSLLDLEGPKDKNQKKNNSGFVITGLSSFSSCSHLLN